VFVEKKSTDTPTYDRDEFSSNIHNNLLLLTISLTAKKNLMVRTKGRVAISKSPRELLLIAQKFYDKHVDMGSSSPLQIIEQPTVDEVLSQAAAAIELHDLAEAMMLQSEKMYRERDLQLEKINNVVKQSVQLLKAAYAGNPKKLADWGIDIDDSKPTKSSKSSEPL
jgi:aminopeptidase C